MVSKIEVGYQSAATVIFPEKGVGKMLLSVYDDGYPRKKYRGHFCFTGGTAAGDPSPRITLERELRAEFTSTVEREEENIGGMIYGAGTHSAAGPFAAEEEMKRLREEIVKGTIPFGDYLVTVNHEALRRKPYIPHLASVFQSFIDQCAFELAEARLREGKRLVNEGYARVLSFDDVREGLVRGAWGYGKILQDILKGQGFVGEIPEYQFTPVEGLGPVLDSYAKYKSRGVYYKQDPEVKASESSGEEIYR